MTVEEIARKIAENSFSELARDSYSYSFDGYWERNRRYFLERAGIYSEVKESLEAGDPASAVYETRRTEKRDRLNASVYYSPLPERNVNGRLWGITVDVSNSGLSIFTDRFVREGFTYKVQSKDLWDDCRTYRLIWCKEVRADLYRSGLSIQA